MSTRSNVSIISQIISAIFAGHALTGGAHFSRRDLDASALSAKDFNRKYR